LTGTEIIFGESPMNRRAPALAARTITSEGSDTTVTDIQDQIDVLPSTEPTTGANPGSRERAKRRSGSVSSMLLPELQALAGSMGISAGKMRKSDLVAAIEGAKSPVATTPSRSASPVSTAASDGATTISDGVTKSAVSAGDSPRVATRTRRSASRPQSPIQPTLTAGVSADATVTGPASATTTREPDGSDRVQAQAESQPQVERQGRDRQAGDRDTADRPERTNQGNRNRDNQNRDNQNRDNQGGQNRDNQGGQNRDNQNRDNQNRDNQNRDNQNRDNQGGQNRDNQGGQNRDNQGGRNQGGQNRNQGNSQGGPRSSAQNDDEDDFGTGARRARRYRDRRGRTRDRFDGQAGGGRNDIEPTINEDDILVPVAGILDNVDEKSSWFIRVSGYFAGPDDVYVANAQIRRYGLRRGDAVTGVVRQAHEGERKEKHNPLVRLDSVNGVDPEQAKGRVEFTNLTPLYPQERLRLETESNVLTTRVIDLVMPLGKGQRALVVSPPKAGKTSVLQAIANAISVNNPECHLMVVLVDERPEEVTDMQRSVKGEVIASTFDRRPQDHTMIAELSIERAKRLVEMGHDVVVLLDSITRLGRAYNLAAPASGRILSGGVDSTALYPPKRFLGAARNIEDGGSLTIIATALVETGSTMDTVIFEEFKGTGNAELILDRKIADKRVFPAIDVDRSGTRKEELLLAPDELGVVLKLRRVLHALDSQQGIELLLDKLKKSRTNIEFLMQIAKTTPGQDDR
jgi:transcription termination factor Rho